MSEGTTTPKKKRLVRVEKISLPKVETIESPELEAPKLVNKGTGAGGANTNLYGKKFEDKTNNELRLLEQGYTKQYYTTKKSPKKQPTPSEYYLSKTFEDKTVIFVLQGGLKSYMKQKYDIELFRCPDEAYIIQYDKEQKIMLKVLEKKEQNGEGSVETKLWACPSLKREYELVLGDNFEVNYGLCVSKYLQDKLVSPDKKYVILNTILTKENNIPVLFGDDEDYFETLDTWLAQ